MTLKPRINETNVIDIWELDINSQNIEIAKQHDNILSELELYKANGFRFFKDFSAYLVSHVAMRLLISMYSKIEPKEIIYQYGNNGKPWVDKAIHFNLSHSHNKALIGFCRKDIGVDIEYKKDLEDYNSIENLVYTKEEKDYINNGIKKDRFYELWTKKEAIVKAIGDGFVKNIKELSIGIKDQYYDGRDIWQISKTKSDPEYISHIAYKNNNVIRRINYFIYNFKIHKHKVVK